MVRNLRVDPFGDFPDHPLRVRLLHVELAQQLTQLVKGEIVWHGRSPTGSHTPLGRVGRRDAPFRVAALTPVKRAIGPGAARLDGRDALPRGTQWAAREHFCSGRWQTNSHSLRA